MSSKLLNQTLAQSEQVSSHRAVGILQRKCACGTHTIAGGECESCGKKRLQRQATARAESDEVPPIVHEVLGSAGQPLDAATRNLMEPRFQHDFSRVRVHTDERAAESASAVNALAYTLGPNIVFAQGQYTPHSSVGRMILAHELTHVVQQRNQSVKEGEPLSLGTMDEHEHQADTSAAAINAGFMPAPVNAMTGAKIMRLTPQEFRKQLGATADQKKAIDALFADQTFLDLWNYLKNCPATPKQDLGPLALDVQPGLILGGKERYGGYIPAPAGPLLLINPTKPEHKANTAELIDTIAHELIHAVDDLAPACKKAGAKDPPLKGAATVASPPKLADVAGKPEEAKLMKELGPGASNPCEEFIDINKAAQQMVIQIIKNNIATTKIGRPTITFVNEILRTDPKAMAEYVKCRDVACAKKTEPERDKEMGVCSANIIAKFMPKTPAPKAVKKP